MRLVGSASALDPFWMHLTARNVVRWPQIGRIEQALKRQRWLAVNRQRTPPLEVEWCTRPNRIRLTIHNCWARELLN